MNKGTEPTRHLLAVVEDGRGRQWFRWSYDTHTFAPWRLIGAVHCDTEDDYRWADLPDDIRVISKGIPNKARDPR